VQRAVPCTILRGGTSKGLYFLREDLPPDDASRDELLQRALGSPDARQIDGLGGAHPLTSKVAVIGASIREGADVDYLFLQVDVTTGAVSSGQNCGNILAGVGPFAIDNGLVAADGDETEVRIRMVNSGSIAVARVQTPNGVVNYEGDARIDGVPGTAAPVMLAFEGIAGANCGAILPTGNTIDTVSGVEVTAIDNGMPVVVMRAADFGLSGYEAPDELENDARLKRAIERIRLEIGPAMNLGDVTSATVPKMCLAAAPRQGGAICTRTFIPHRVHQAVGVLGAVSVASACLFDGSVVSELTTAERRAGTHLLGVEHPTGAFDVELDVDLQGTITRAALLRTARKLMQGVVYC